MSEIPEDLLYTSEHEWVRKEADGTLVFGITDYAQESLGDITFVELPEVGVHLDRGASFGVVESVKAASDLYAPVGGEVLAVNEILDGSPDQLNSDPYGDAWLVKVSPSNLAEMDDLMDAASYTKLV